MKSERREEGKERGGRQGRREGERREAGKQGRREGGGREAGKERGGRQGSREGERREAGKQRRREEGGREAGKERGGGDEGDTKRHNLLVSTVFLMHCRATSPCWRPSFVNGASNTKLLSLLTRSNCVGLSRSVSSVKYGSMCVI